MIVKHCSCPPIPSPEVVQNQAYGEKADIWALGCVLYQMCMLEPPFASSNMLNLVNKVSVLCVYVSVCVCVLYVNVSVHIFKFSPTVL